MRKKAPGRKSRATKENELSDLFAELKGEYLESFPEKFSAMQSYWQSGQRDALQNEFHKIKGTGTTYGLPEVSEVAEIIEDMCIQNSDRLGVGILLAFDLLHKICENYKHNIPYELHKDPLFKRLGQLYDSMEDAS
jgi:HPt (histidine-containing phosphotransfer) domain-containing protein